MSAPLTADRRRAIRRLAVELSGSHGGERALLLRAARMLCRRGTTVRWTSTPLGVDATIAGRRVALRGGGAAGCACDEVDHRSVTCSHVWALLLLLILESRERYGGAT